MQTIHPDLPDNLVGRFETADRLAPLMTSASQIAGNPRLIKRFLNALSIRMAIARAHSVGVDEAVLAKLMLFERCGDQDAYRELIRTINEDEEGKPHLLADWEKQTFTGNEVRLEGYWDSSFFREWLAIPPRLAETDLRGALYVSRENAPLITPEDRLSSTGAELLSAILEHPAMAGELHSSLTQLPRPEISIIMDRVLERARKEQEWGTPPILEAALAVAAVDPAQGTRLSAFLHDRPLAQITPSIVPRISGYPWAPKVLVFWQSSDVAAPVKKAIAQRSNPA
jgi:predicted KAP-like P-loop ATPase